MENEAFCALSLNSLAFLLGAELTPFELDIGAIWHEAMIFPAAGRCQEIRIRRPGRLILTKEMSAEVLFRDGTEPGAPLSKQRQ
jgi:hypothetical protein